MAVLWVILWFVLGCLALVLLALCLPFHVSARARFADGVSYDADVRVGGASAPRLMRLTGKPPQPPSKTDEPEARQPGKRRRPGARWMKGFALEAPHLVAQLIGSVRLDHVAVNAEFGTGDPAETGQIFGQLCPVIYGVPDSGINVAPNFERACLSGEGEVAVHVIPIRLLTVMAASAARVLWRLR